MIMHYIIYKTTNKVNNKFYVGQHQTENINDSYIGSGLLLGYAIKKYGIENFEREILETCSDKYAMNEREKFWIEKLDARNRKVGYNIAFGGFNFSSEFWSSLSIDEKLTHCEKMKKPKVIKDRDKWASDRIIGTLLAWEDGRFDVRDFRGELNPRYNDISADDINTIKLEYESMVLTKGEIFKKYNIGKTVFRRISKDFKHPPKCWWNIKRGKRCQISR